jgi:hypothetical protein
MDRLRDKFLNVPVDAILHPASDSAQQVAKEQKDKAIMALYDDLKSKLAALEQQLALEQQFQRLSRSSVLGDSEDLSDKLAKRRDELIGTLSSVKKSNE